MATRMKKNADLEVGDVMALPFEKTATITHITLGPRVIRLRTEYGMTKLNTIGETMVEVEDTEE